MPKMVVLSQAGKELHEITLADTVFGIEPNQQCIFDAIVMQRASMRQGTHDTKNRTEVRGGGRKPWRQKGTGRARQGSIRATQWRGCLLYTSCYRFDDCDSGCYLDCHWHGSVKEL